MSASSIPKVMPMEVMQMPVELQCTKFSKLPCLSKPAQFVVHKEADKKMVLSSSGFDCMPSTSNPVNKNIVKASNIAFKDDALEREIKGMFN